MKAKPGEAVTGSGSGVLREGGPAGHAPGDRAFHSPEISRITGTPSRTLDWYAKEGILRPSIVDAHGRGSEPLYSYADLLAAYVLRLIPTDSRVVRIKFVEVIRSDPEAGVVSFQFLDILDWALNLKRVRQEIAKRMKPA